MSLQKAFLKVVAILLLAGGLALPSAAQTQNASPAPGSEQWMVSVYQEGKRLFDLGDHDGAQREWDKLSGSYDKNPSLKVIVDFMRKRIKEDPNTVQHGRQYQDKQKALAEKKAAEELAAQKKQEPQKLKKSKASAKKSRSFETNEADPDESVKAFLEKARQDVTKQVHAVNRRGATMDSKRAVQQMLALFTKGKEAYLNGDFARAMAAWDEAVTYLPPNAGAKRELEELRMHLMRRSLPKPKVQAELIEEEEEEVSPVKSAASEPVKAPDDMKDFLGLVNARFRSEAQEGRAKKIQRTVSSSDRQDAVDRSFRKSKLLYFQGEYEQAIDELNALAKYFPEGSEEARLIAGLRQNYLEALKAQGEAAQAAPAEPAPVKGPADLKSFLDQANRKFDALIEEARARQSAVSETSAERQKFVDSAFQNARTDFSKGMIGEGLAELERVAPYVQNGDEILSLVDEIRANEIEAKKAQEALKSPAAVETKLNAAATKGITDFLKDAEKRLAAESTKAAARRKEAESLATSRSRRMIDLFQNARSYYESGNLEGALDLLSQMTPDLKDGDRLNESIAAIRADLEQSRKTAAELKELEARQKETQALPQELSGLLKETQTSIREHAESVSRQLTAAQQSREIKKQAYDKAYAAGRQAYNKGDLEAALNEWEKMVPLVENGEEFSRYLKDVRADYQKALEAEKLSKQAQPDAPLRLPDDFYQLLNDTAAKARARSEQAAADQKAGEQASSSRRQAVEQVFEAGRQAYNNGDLDTAIAQWKKLVPEVENGQTLGAALDRLSQDYRAALKAVEASEAAARKPTVTFKSAPELDKFLAEARKQIESRDRDARAKIQSLEKNAAEKKGAYDRALAEGKAAYAAGDLDRALASWKMLTSIVEDGASLDKQIGEVRERFREAQKAVAAAEEAQKTKALRAPDEVVRFLETVQKDSEAKSREALSKKQAAEKAAADRQAAYDRALAEGKAAYKAGDLSAAVQAWKALVPVVDGAADLDRQLSETLTRLKESEAAAQAAETAKKTKPLSVPAEIGKILDTAQKDAEKKTQDAVARKESLDRDMADRQAVYNRALAEGKAAYKAGDLDAALTAWKALVPVVDDGKALDQQLLKLREQFRLAKSAIDALEATQKAAILQTPSEINKLLSEAQQQVEKKGQEAATQKRALEKAAAEKKAAYDRAVSEGKAAYKAGDLEAAIAAWSGLASIVDDGAALQKQLAALKEQAQTARETRQAAEDLAKQKVVYPVPADLGAALADVSKKLQSDIAQSQELAAVSQAQLAERQKRVQTAVAEGLDLYKTGLTAEAVRRWESILPELEDGDRLQKAILDLSRADQELSVVQKAALQSEIDSKKPLVVPVDLTKALDSAFASAKAKLEEAKNRQSAANEESVRHQTIVTESIQNGKLALARGDVDAAVAEWTKAAPFLQNGQALIPKLQDLKIAHRQLEEARKAAEDAEQRNQAKIASLPEVEAFITESTLKYKNEMDAANVRREQAEASYAEKKALVEHTVNKAREIFEKGDIPGANQEALKLQPLVEDPVTLQADLAKIQTAYDDSVKAQETAAASVKNAVDAKFKPPVEMALLLKDADAKVKELSQLAMNQKLEAEQSLKEKEAFVQQTFERGKNLYWQGKLDEALAAWDSLAPLLENGDRIKDINGRYEETLNLQRQAREMSARRNEKFQTPEELQRLLNDAEKVLQSQANYASTQQQTAQGELSERQDFINKTFQRGKALYEQGMIPDAIEEWERLTPVLENGSKVKEFIDGVKANFKNAASAKKGAEEAQARSIVAAQAPADLTRLLGEANQALEAETKRSQEERKKAEESLREKQRMVDNIFQKGKSLYQAGRLEEAVDTWKTLLPYVDDNTAIRQLIQQAEDSRRRLLAERYESQNRVSQMSAASTPTAMQFALEETNMALKDQISQQQQARITRDLQDLIGGKPSASKGPALPLDRRAAAAGQSGTDSAQVPFKLDEIEQMMLEYKVVTPEDLKKRHEDLKAKASAEAEAPAV